MSALYNHQSLPATPAAAVGGSHGPMVVGPGGGAVIGGGPVVAGPTAPGGYPPRMPGVERVVEYLDVVKNEFEGLQGDCVILKGQRDEYETKINQQIQEVATIRQSLYDLESQHAKIRAEYEAEITRLRRELDARAGGPSNHPGGPAPTIGSGNGASASFVGGGIGSLPSALPALPGALPSIGDRDRERERVRDEREREKERDYRYSKMDVDEKKPSPYPASAMPPMQTTASSASARPASTPQPKTPPTMLSDLDPDTVPRELKKEGSDWFALWSPKVKKQLDVNLVHTLAHESVVCCVKFSFDGQFLATGCNRTAQIYDTKTGQKTCVLVDDAASTAGDLYIRSICFSPDSKYLATGAEDRQIRIWDIEKKRIRHLLQGHMQEIYSLDFSRDGQFLVSGSGDKTAKIWNIETGTCVFDLKIDDFVMGDTGPIDAGITSVALSPDSRLVAAGSLDTIVRVWDTATGQQVERLKGHKDSVYSVAFSPDGQFLVSGSLDRSIRLWDLGHMKRSLEKNGKDQRSVLSARDGSNTICQTLSGHKDYVLSVAVSPDGQWVVSGSKDRSIQFWNIATGQAQFMLQGHKNSVISIDLAKSGNLLASGSGDYQARIWSYSPVRA